MRTIPAALGITDETTSIARAWKVTLQSGTVLGFTNHDQDKTIDGIVYLASTGYTSSAIETSASLAVDNLEIDSMLQAPSLTEADFLAGKWDHASVEMFDFNWRAPTSSKANVRKMRIGEISKAGSHFKSEMRGLLQQLQQNIGAIYQPACRATFGDAQCKFNKATVTSNGTVQSISADGLTIVDSSLSFINPDVLKAGELSWTSGLNSALKGEIKSNTTGGSITLQIPPPYLPSIGDTFSVVAGCLKRANEDCRDKFNNIINFRGEPHLPGMFKISQTPIQ